METFNYFNFKFHSMKATSASFPSNHICLAVKQYRQDRGRLLVLVTHCYSLASPSFQWALGMTGGKMEVLITLPDSGALLNTDPRIFLTFLSYLKARTGYQPLFTEIQPY